ncbi:MAG: ATP-binding protein, partial [Myxococcota bacterium]
ALFGVALSPANRYGGFKALRARWWAHIKSHLLRPVLLVDEAQEMPSNCLNELRLLSAAHFDSECLLTTVLCGDTRLPDRFRTRELLPLGSRVRTRLVLEPFDKTELRRFLDHLLDHAGAPQLVTDELKAALVDHAGGNPRILISMAADLLVHGLQQERGVLDEKLFLQVFDLPRRNKRLAKG